MTREETEKAFREGLPVKYSFWNEEYHYPNINTLRYTRNEIGGVTLSVELLDKNSNCIQRAKPEHIMLDC